MNKKLTADRFRQMTQEIQATLNAVSSIFSVVINPPSRPGQPLSVCIGIPNKKSSTQSTTLAHFKNGDNEITWTPMMREDLLEKVVSNQAEKNFNVFNAIADAIEGPFLKRYPDASKLPRRMIKLTPSPVATPKITPKRLPPERVVEQMVAKDQKFYFGVGRILKHVNNKVLQRSPGYVARIGALVIQQPIVNPRSKRVSGVSVQIFNGTQKKWIGTIQKGGNICWDHDVEDLIKHGNYVRRDNGRAKDSSRLHRNRGILLSMCQSLSAQVAKAMYHNEL